MNLKITIQVFLLLLSSNNVCAQQIGTDQTNCCSGSKSIFAEKIGQKLLDNEYFTTLEVDYLPKNFCGPSGHIYAPSAKLCFNTFEKYLSQCLYQKEDFEILDHSIVDISNYLLEDIGIRPSSIPHDPCVWLNIKINKEGVVEKATIVTTNFTMRSTIHRTEIPSDFQSLILINLKEILNLMTGSTCNPALFNNSKVNIELDYIIVFRENKNLRSIQRLH